eukprot:8959391-Pyramimonas_sp.AAC.1
MAQDGLVISFVAGRSQVMVQVNGRDKAWCKRLPSVELQGQSYIPSLQETVGMVAAHKSLGALLAADGSVGPEVAYRCGAARAIAGAMSRTVFRMRGVSLAAKLQYHAALIESKIIHNAETWGQLSEKRKQQLESAYYGSLRRAV